MALHPPPSHGYRRPDDVGESVVTYRRGILAVLLLALVARLAFLFTFGSGSELHGDENYYVAKALSLVTSGRYPGAFRPPGQSAFLAAVFAIFDDSVLAARLAQIAVSLTTVAAVFDLAHRHHGARPAVIAGAACALHPTLVSYSSFLWSETLYAAMLVAVIWLLDRYAATVRPSLAVCAGALLGTAALTRETGLYLLPLIAIWILVQPSPQRARASIASVVGFVLVVSPWLLRNVQAFDTPTISTNRWRVVAYGNASRDQLLEMRSMARARGGGKGANRA